MKSGNRLFFWPLFLFLFSIDALQAGSPELNNIDRADLDNVVKEFSANFTHTTVSPAKSLGRVWGFEVGVLAGITKTPKLEALVHEVSPSTDIGEVPHGGLLGMVTFPYGITGEVTLVPETTASGVTVENKSAGVKWTVTDVFPLPTVVDILSAAVRFHISTSDLSYKQTIRNSSTGNIPVDATILFDSTVWGLNTTISADVLIFEPYVGFGFAKSSTDVSIKATGSATIFTGDVITASSGQAASSKPSSAHIFAGVQMDMILAHLSAEISRVFDTTSYMGKFSFYY